MATDAQAAPTTLPALLLLADGRFPAGGYGHSGGLEAAIAASQVRDVKTLESFLAGRASTAGAVSATFAASACRAVWSQDQVGSRLHALDVELDARMPSPAQRSTSRQLGRQLLRVMTAIAAHPALQQLGLRPHQPLAFGTACAALDLSAHDAALASLHEAVAGPAAAAVRLLSLDPFATHAALVRLGPLLADLAAQATDDSTGDAAELPAPAAPLLDLYAERHAVRTARLFAS